MASPHISYGGSTNMPSSPTRADRPEESRCAVCQQSNCDIQIVSCGCLLHTTCLPLDVLFVKQQMGGNNYTNQQTFCPCCRQSPIMQIRVLPLPMTVLEEAARLREKDNEMLSITNNEVSSLACGSPANSIALFNGTTGKRPFAAKTSICRSYRTGRWASEESSFTDKLIKAFDAGLLPLPHGIKLNDFLCDLLSCRTSRLTKKLKNAKLSARTYRSWASGGGTAGSVNTSYVGGDIQRAQTLFLKTITPEWVRMELQFNISRMWRTHLANFCLQISYLQLDTKEWFASLDAVDYVAMSCNESKLEARKKRMKSALTEDANVAARTALSILTRDTSSTSNAEDTSEAASCTSSDKEGVFVGGLPFKRLSDMNLKSLAEKEENDLKVNTGAGVEDDISRQRERFDSLGGSMKGGTVSIRKFSFESSVFEQTMKHSTSLSSFVDLFTPDMRPKDPSRSRRASSIDIDAPSIDVAEDGVFEISSGNQQQSDTADTEVDTIIDEAIESVIESSSTEKDYQGLFLKEIAKFLSESDSPFQHVDLWVPMDVSHSDIVGKKHIGSSSMATTSSSKVTGIIYGGQQSSSVRLSNAGSITIRAQPQIMNSMNEFGMYSKNFSFSPGFGMPGRVYLSKTPLWENNLTELKTDQFARVGGAKIYGVNTVLSIPVFTPIGTMVVALYSMQNLSRDVAWERKCQQLFWKLKPEPKWKLTIDVGLKTSPEDAPGMPASQVSTSSPRMESVKKQSFVIPPSPTTSTPTIASDLTLESKKPGTTPQAPNILDEQSLALLIGKYMPLDHYSPGSANSIASNREVADNLMSLRLLLLRHPSCRSNTDSKMIEIIMGKYQSYLLANKKEHDLILCIVNDWKRLVMLSSSISEAQVTAAYNARLSVTRHNSVASDYSIGSFNQATVASLNQGNYSPMLSPTPNSFIPNSGAPASSFQKQMSSVSQFGDNFTLPLTGFGVPLNSIPEQQQIGQNVPRVVSENGPIEKDTNVKQEYGP